MDRQLTQESEIFTDAQGHWWSASSTKSAIDNAAEKRDAQVEMPKTTKKKTKSRGNRKLQRYRSKLIKQGHQPESIAKLLCCPTHVSANQKRSDENESQQQYENMKKNERKTGRKRKRNRSATDGTPLIKSLSGISISQPTAKKTCHATVCNQMDDPNEPEFHGDERSYEISKSLPNFLRVPDHIFKRQILQEVTQDQTTIEGWLNNDAMLQYIRECARLTNNYCYWKAEYDFWQHYVTTTKNETLWLSQVSKQIIHQSGIYWQYCTTEKNINKREKELKRKSERAAIQLNEHIQKTPPLPVDSNSATVHIMNHLSGAILMFVNKGQQTLRDKFKQREATLKLDIEDVRLMKSFYQQAPSEKQIHSANIIWQATSNEQKAKRKVAILKRRLQTNRLPPSYQALDHSIDNIPAITKEPGFDEHKRNILLTSRQNRIAQYKYEMMALTIEATESLVRSHAQIVHGELTTTWIPQTAASKSLSTSLSSWTCLFNIVEQRQKLIIKRNEIEMKRDLSFFDLAPVATPVNENAGH